MLESVICYEMLPIGSQTEIKLQLQSGNILLKYLDPLRDLPSNGTIFSAYNFCNLVYMFIVCTIYEPQHDNTLWPGQRLQRWE